MSFYVPQCWTYESIFFIVLTEIHTENLCHEDYRSIKIQLKYHFGMLESLSLSLSPVLYDLNKSSSLISLAAVFMITVFSNNKPRHVLRTTRGKEIKILLQAATIKAQQT